MLEHNKIWAWSGATHVTLRIIHIVNWVATMFFPNRMFAKTNERQRLKLFYRVNCLNYIFFHHCQLSIQRGGLSHNFVAYCWPSYSKYIKGRIKENFVWKGRIKEEIYQKNLLKKNYFSLVGLIFLNNREVSSLFWRAWEICA